MDQRVGRGSRAKGGKTGKRAYLRGVNVSSIVILIAGFLSFGGSPALASTSPTFRSLTSANTALDHLTSLTIATPSTTANGDLLLLFFESSDAQDPTGLSGWTKIDSGDAGQSLRGQSYYRIASNEPSSYTLTYATAIHIGAVMMDYSGVDPNAPVSSHGVVHDGSYVTTLTSPTLAGVGPNDLTVISFHARGVPVGPFTFTLPSGWTERVQQTTNSPNNPDVGASEVELLGPGGTPTETTPIQVTYVTTAVALHPASAVSDSPPVARIAVTPASGQSSLGVTADASTSTDTDATPIASYAFDFGDGSAAVGPQPGPTATHTYHSAGTYTVTVTVADTAGLTSTATAQVQVSSADSPPVARLSVTPSSGQAPLGVTADASASTDSDSTPIASYTFSFGDGSTSVGPQSGASASHTYAAAGTYTVTVTVTDSGGLTSIASAQVQATTVPTNLVGNPGFETNTVGWSAVGSGITLSRVSSGHSGSWAAQVLNAGSVSTTADLNDTPNWVTTTAPGTYTISAWVRSASSSNPQLTLKVQETAGSKKAGSVQSKITLSSSWKQISMTYVATAPGKSTLDLDLFVQRLGAQQSFYVDDVSITLA